MNPLGDQGLFCVSSKQVKGYVNLATQEGGTIVCGEGKDQPPDLPEDYRQVCILNT